MLPDDFSFAQLEPGNEYTLKEVGMLSSTLEDIDSALVNWVKMLHLSTTTNEGFKEVNVLWQAPERAFQVKHNQLLRDDGGALKLPLISVERASINKDPQRKGGYQAQTYSDNHDGRTGRLVIARRIVPQKTQNFAIASGARTTLKSVKRQLYYPRKNHKVVVQSLSIPIPVYVNVEYKISLKSEYQQQMNDMMQPFLTRTGQINSFVMRKNGHLYEAFIDGSLSSANNVANLAEESRMFSTEISIRVLGYLIGEGDSDDRPIVRIEENAVEYLFPSESEQPTGNPTLFNE
tara:strand:- start:505 stop:1377 length:873 start_codon:yes stop_codon:yes gene_type:complete